MLIVVCLRHILVQQAKIRKKKKRPAKNRQKLNFHPSQERFSAHSRLSLDRTFLNFFVRDAEFDLILYLYGGNFLDWNFQTYLSAQSQSESPPRKVERALLMFHWLRALIGADFPVGTLGLW